MKKNISFILVLSAMIFLYNCSSEKILMNDIAESTGEELFSIGLAADIQFADIYNEVAKNRYYRKSIDKLREYITFCNNMDLEFCVDLGDLIDREFSSFSVINDLYAKLTVKKYQVAGNHDFEVSDDKKSQVYSQLGLSEHYYSFNKSGWRFIVTDGNDLSFYSSPENSEQWLSSKKYYDDNNIDSPDWNGGIGQKQLVWLKSELESAETLGENVVIFCHFPVFPEDKTHQLWNSRELIDLISPFYCVKAWINGHNHSGDYGLKNGIHFLTIPGMVNTSDTSAFAVGRFFEDRIEIDGFQRCTDMILKLR